MSKKSLRGALVFLCITFFFFLTPVSMSNEEKLSPDNQKPVIPLETSNKPEEVEKDTVFNDPHHRKMMDYVLKNGKDEGFNKVVRWPTGKVLNGQECMSQIVLMREPDPRSPKDLAKAIPKEVIAVNSCDKK